ncbi:hypothetical protein CJF32_00003256 [Rutstroemia sp. NJR-2017a WRK4]|nr:hypothetical protein CJF32_00003256 [Rutstroemia sp. NJR-2017a WRK4]
MSRYSFQNNDDRFNSSSPQVSPQHSPTRPYQQAPSHSPLDSASNRGQGQIQDHRQSNQQFQNYNQQTENSNSLSSSAQPDYYAEPVSPITDTGSPPIPPPHRNGNRAQESRFGTRNNNNQPISAYSNVTTGADNFSDQAAGGINGVAMSVAQANARESGLEAMRNTRGYDPTQPSYEEPTFQRPHTRTDASTSSLTPLSAAAFPTGMSTPSSRSTISRSNPPSDPYSDSPYPFNRYSRTNLDPELVEFDPNTIEDDGDDGLGYRPVHRSSVLSINKMSDNGSRTPPGTKAAAAGGVMGSLGGLVGRKNGENVQYDHVTNANGPNDYDLAAEKNEWLRKPPGGNKKLRLWIALIVGFLIIGGIVGGAIGGTLGGSHGGDGRSGTTQAATSGQSASSDTANNGDLSKDSAEIQKLLGNPKLHKVFPGIDYTPMYTQYPDCLSYPPSQNNVTRDVAVLSQLTNTIRLYGTDCNQTEMVLHAIDRLGLNGTVKVWLGVWQDTNSTTNTRQLDQLYKIFDTHGSSSFVGVIVGNEVLYRKDMTSAQLTTVITDVKDNMTSRGIDLPIASSDLGDNWTSELANVVDYVMANIHPFFAGVTADEGAGWTWNFWQTHDVALKPDKSKNIISETGWPSQGGTDCGAASSCTTGSVAGITEMNSFMDNWVCDALTNGTNYFWFEAFDEPWKIHYNTANQNWEDHWGLLTVDRVLKDGVVIPDCGGKVVS